MTATIEHLGNKLRQFGKFIEEFKPRPYSNRVETHGIVEARQELTLKEQEIINKAKEIFSGTNIIETLEDKRRKGIFVSFEYNDLVSGKVKNSPALVLGDSNSLTLLFNCCYRKNIEGLFNKGLPSSFDSITVSKEEKNALQLIYKGQKEQGGFSLFSTNPIDIIDGINRVVEIKKEKKRGCL